MRARGHRMPAVDRASAPRAARPDLYTRIPSRRPGLSESPPSTVTGASARAGRRRCSVKVRPGTVSRSARTGSRTPSQSNPSRTTNRRSRSSRSRPTGRANGSRRSSNPDTQRSSPVRRPPGHARGSDLAGKDLEVFTGRICQSAHWCVRFGRDRPCPWAGLDPSDWRHHPRAATDPTLMRPSLEVVAHA